MNKALITFGCSWTFGVGAGFGAEYESKNALELTKKCWDTSINEKYSFRSLLCKKYRLDNINFSKGGSSNQTQFRLAENFFISENFEDLQIRYNNNIYVMWCITSVFRGDYYVKRDNKFTSICYNHTVNDLENKLSKLILDHFYDYDVEIETLNTHMHHWNQYFSGLGIKNIWIDTFNHHDYINPVYNLCFKNENPRDLLSKMTKFCDSEKYHTSVWKVDKKTIQKGISLNLLNPYSKHPNAIGHSTIAKILSPEIEKLIN